MIESPKPYFPSSSEWRNLAYNTETYLRDLETNTEPPEMDRCLCKEWTCRGLLGSSGELNRSLFARKVGPDDP